MESIWPLLLNVTGCVVDDVLGDLLEACRVIERVAWEEECSVVVMVIEQLANGGFLVKGVPRREPSLCSGCLCA